MLSTFLRILVDVAYLVPFKVKRFHTKHPNETVLVAGGSKAIRLKEDQKVSRGAKWIVAKRGVLILSDKRLVCGSWNIELDQIVNAQILKTKSFFVKALVLKIETKEVQHYQFGLQYDPKWIAQKVLPVKIEEGKIAYSLFSIIIRLALLGYIIWWIIQRLRL